MTDYHAVYKGLPTDTTQWDDIQRRLGNLPPRPEVWKPEAYTPEQEQAKDVAWLESRDAQELSDAEDDFADDRFMEEYRRKRMAELQHVVHRPRFGTVEEIRAAEFVQKVTEASKGTQQPQEPAQPQASTPGREDGATGEDTGLWVVVHLYKDGLGVSALMGRCVEDLAERYPHTKFVRIVSTDCIPKYPDANLPTLLVYHGGQCVKHLVGLSTFGGSRTTPEQVALVLNRLGPVCSNVAEDDQDAGRKEDAHLVRQLVQRVVTSREQDDESSDFDD